MDEEDDAMDYDVFPPLNHFVVIVDCVISMRN